MSEEEVEMRIQLLVLLAGFCGIVSAGCGDDPLEKVRLPPGFGVQVFAVVPGARGITVGRNGRVYVVNEVDGSVVELRDRDGDGRSDSRRILYRGLRKGHGVAWHQEYLYVADRGRILRFPAAVQHSDKLRPEVIARLPDAAHHGTREIGFGPDGKLYVALGAPCNVCEKPGFDEILRMNPDGSRMETFARGVRNSVGLAWHPQTGVLWFSDNGRDLMGDDVPPDELNRARRPGLHFGFPYCHGGGIADPVLGRGADCGRFEPPAWKFQAHVAPLGLHFYRGRMFPADYRHDLLVAQHGSWNRSEPVGYRLVRLRIEQGKVVEQHAFVSGWLGTGGERCGRPVALAELPDGSLLVTDDFNGLVYRIAYSDTGT